MRNITLFLYLFISFMALYIPIKKRADVHKGFRVKVAVIDVGMDDAVNGNNSSWSKYDSIHGKRVVNTILKNNPSVEIIKFNYNPMTLKSFEDTLTLAIDARPHIINASSSGTVKSQREMALLEKASRLGIVVVVAAGNEGRQISKDFKPYPLSYKTSSLVSVGSLDIYGKIANFSNYGEGVDIYLDGIVDLKINGIHHIFKGTSASTAIASAQIARLVSPQTSPMAAKNKFLKYSNSELINRSISSCR